MNYSDFCTSDDHSLNISLAIEHCKRNGIDTLTFDKGTYTLTAPRASVRPISISNHDVCEYTSIGMLIDGMENFTVDGGGSKFICDGVMVTAGILNSKNITFKNMKLEAKGVLRCEATVVEHGEDSFTVRITNDVDYYVQDKNLHFKNEYGHDDTFHYYMIVCREGDQKGYIPETRETFKKTIWFEDLGDRLVRFNHPTFIPDIGMRLIIAPSPRHGATFFAEKSEDIAIENVDIYTSYGMGVIAQVCKNVTVDSMTIKATEGRLYSVNNDATHFVHCEGLIKITNSFFEAMLDDALNVHGLYAPVEHVDQRGILVRDMHPGSKGMPIYREGGHIVTLDPLLLIPIKKYTITSVRVISPDYAYLTLAEGTEGITVGLVTEETDLSPDILFENNTVQNNRARGVLLASHGKTVIRNNYFHTPGISIMFESNGNFWFEAGNTEDVLIEGNVFDNCGYSILSWGKAVIEGKPRKEFDGVNYFHKSIRIINNEFKDNVRPIIVMGNVEEVIFKGNRITNTVAENEYTDCKTVIEEN